MEPIQKGLYKHFRGNLYQVLGVTRHSETLEELVLYQALYGDYGLWVRPRSLFFDVVNHDGALCSRFTFIADNLGTPPQLR